MLDQRACQDGPVREVAGADLTVGSPGVETKGYRRIRCIESGEGAEAEEGKARVVQTRGGVGQPVRQGQTGQSLEKTETCLLKRRAFLWARRGNVLVA